MLFTDDVKPSMFVFILFYGLDWVATVPPTIALCRAYFGPERGAIVFGWWLMAATPTLTTLAGAALIASSGLYTAWREHIRRKASLIQPTAPLV